MVIPKTICWAIAKANSFVHVVMFVFRTKKTIILLTIIEFEKKFWLQIKYIIDNNLANCLTALKIPRIEKVISFADESELFAC